jgi:hypothetical protein
MRTDYFDDLLPDFVTAVTSQKPELVTPENTNIPSKNHDLGEALPVLPLLPVKTGNTDEAIAEHLDERAIDPFRHDLPCAPERITPVPDPSWRAGQWQAYAARGTTAAERRSRLWEAPKQYRRQLLTHVRTMFAIQTKFRERVTPA